MVAVAEVVEEGKEAAVEEEAEEEADVVEERRTLILDLTMMPTTVAETITTEAIGTVNTTRTILGINVNPANHLSPTRRKMEKREPMPTPSRKKHESDLPRFSWTFERTKAKPSANFQQI